MIISNNIINIFFSSATATNENMVRLLIDKYPLYMLFSVAIYAPIVEETIFRRSIKDITDNTSNNIIKKKMLNTWHQCPSLPASMNNVQAKHPQH